MSEGGEARVGIIERPLDAEHKAGLADASRALRRDCMMAPGERTPFSDRDAERAVSAYLAHFRQRTLHRCSRCGEITEKLPRFSPGKCPLFHGDTTHSPHDWKAVRTRLVIE